MTGNAPYRVSADSALVPAILALIRQTFAYMQSRIDPPSSMHRLSVDAIREHCTNGEVWVIGDRPHACVFLRDKGDCLYLGKLAVAADQRGKGHARSLIELAVRRARQKGMSAVELEARIELVENHRAFARLGFEKVGETAHEGYDRPTSITMRMVVASGPGQGHDL